MFISINSSATQPHIKCHMKATVVEQDLIAKNSLMDSGTSQPMN